MDNNTKNPIIVPEFTSEQLRFLKDIFTPRCCHTTGMHDPMHFSERRYICGDQKAQAFDRGRLLLGFGKVTPDDAIPSDECFWCNSQK